MVLDILNHNFLTVTGVLNLDCLAVTCQTKTPVVASLWKQVPLSECLKIIKNWIEISF